MKLLIALSFSVFSSTLFAMPAVGDMAVYKVHANGYEITQKIELVSYNPADKTYAQKETMSVFGQESVQVKNVPADGFLTDAVIAQVLTYCQSSEIGGTLETVTVAAGTFQSCAITSEEGRSNIAAVPFGVVKFSSPSASLELIQYKAGK